MSIEYMHKHIDNRRSSKQDRILVVDDQATERKILRRILEKCRYEVIECASGEEALQLIHGEDFSLVLMDIVMPDVSGLETLKRARRRFSMSDLPVIMVSSRGESKDVVKALDYGANDYIIKPIDHSVLCARVKTHLSHKLAVDEVARIKRELEQRVKERTATLLEANQELEREIAERKHIEERFREVQHITNLGIWEIDYTADKTYWSDEVYAIFGLTRDSVDPTPDNVMEFVHPDDRERVLKYRAAARKKNIPFNLKYRIVRPDGDIRYVHGQGEIIRKEEGEPLRFVGTIVDETTVSILSEKLSYQSSHDTLSGLLNRSEFELRLQQILESAKVDQSEHVLCYLDLDQFKVVNNTYGHVAGDELLRQLSTYLQGRIRIRDIFARMGGDEFGLLLEYCKPSEATRILNNLREALEGFEFEWQGKIFTITASIGAVPVNKDSGNLAEVLSLADIACYAAKDAGRNRIHIHSANDDTTGKRQREMHWVERINRAIQEDRFRLYYQPIIDLHGSMNMTHYELLIRMQDESGNIVQPGTFLPAAERYSLSTKIDRWVIQTAFSAIEACPELHNQGVCLGINLSGQSLADEELLDFLADEIKRKHISPGKAYFEITETAAIANFRNAKWLIKALKNKGFQFALDDFGSGLSSFSYLKNLDVDIIKIDGQFVRDILESKVSYEMVAAIDKICKSMAKKTIAEFVEDEKTMIALREIGIDYGQGYYFGKPQPLEKLLSNDSLHPVYNGETVDPPDGTSG